MRAPPCEVPAFGWPTGRCCKCSRACKLRAANCNGSCRSTKARYAHQNSDIHPQHSPRTAPESSRRDASTARAIGGVRALRCSSDKRELVRGHAIEGWATWLAVPLRLLAVRTRCESRVSQMHIPVFAASGPEAYGGAQSGAQNRCDQDVYQLCDWNRAILITFDFLTPTSAQGGTVAKPAWTEIARRRRGEKEGGPAPGCGGVALKG